MKRLQFQSFSSNEASEIWKSSSNSRIWVDCWQLRVDILKYTIFQCLQIISDSKGGGAGEKRLWICGELWMYLRTTRENKLATCLRHHNWVCGHHTILCNLMTEHAHKPRQALSMTTILGFCVWYCHTRLNQLRVIFWCSHANSCQACRFLCVYLPYMFPK